jgi:hypothetical protein
MTMLRSHRFSWRNKKEIPGGIASDVPPNPPIISSYCDCFYNRLDITITVDKWVL